MKKELIFSFLLPLFASCCKDDNNNPIPPIIDCMKGLKEFVEPASEVVDSSIAQCDECIIDCEEIYSSVIPYDYYYPCFNPINPEQLAYYRYDNTVFNFASELWVVDFCTGEKKMLADNLLYGLDWSVKDWLVYTAADQNIWKIKSNGDSLTQLTFVGDFNRYPKWSPDGDKIAFNSEIQGSNYFFISNELGEQKDTIEALATSGAWSWIDNDQICYFVAESNGGITAQKMNVYNIQTQEIRFLHSLHIEHNSDSLVLNTTYFPSENSIVWCAIGFVGKTNLATGTFEILRERLFQERFHSLVVRPGKDQFLFNKSSMHYVEPCSVDSQFDFFIIEKNGTNQRKVNLPE